MTSTTGRSATGKYHIKVGRSDGGVVIRNAQDPRGPSLWFTLDELAAFLDGARAGEFDDLLKDPR